MEETKKRDGSDGDGDETTMKRSKTQAISDFSGNFGDDIVAWLSVDDDDTDTVDELMKLLDTDADGVSITSSSSCCFSSYGNGSKVKFIENPYSSLLIFQSSSSYITINGNEESCGSSFSDWESSVMASVDMSGISMNAGKTDDDDGFCEWFQGGKGGGAWGLSEVEEARGGVVTEEEYGGGGGKRLTKGSVDWDWKDEDLILTTE